MQCAFDQSLLFVFACYWLCRSSLLPTYVVALQSLGGLVHAMVARGASSRGRCAHCLEICRVCSVRAATYMRSSSYEPTNLFADVDYVCFGANCTNEQVGMKFPWTVYTTLAILYCPGCLLFQQTQETFWRAPRLPREPLQAVASAQLCCCFVNSFVQRNTSPVSAAFPVGLWDWIFWRLY